MDVGSLRVLIGGDVGGLMSALQRADRELSGFAGRIGGGMERMGRSMQTVGAAMAPVSLALAGIGTVGVRTASQFDSIMAEIAARTGATGAEMQRISDFALQMGADTAFSAQQAGDAFLQLLTSGQTAEQAIATLPAVLDAAAASGADLGQTADMLTDIMASMGIDIEYANDVANDLARAAGASSATIESLGQGFANVGPMAANFGMSMRDTAAVLAVLSENGIKGSEAGTALKSMLTNMTRPTEAVRGAWEELGVSFYDAAGNARPLQNVIADLDRALDPLTVERQNELMYDLAGSYGIVALSALRGELSIEDMILMMTEAADASTVAEARMDTFAGTVDTLKGSVETLNITAFTPFMNDTLKPLFKRMTTVVNAMTTLARLNPGLTSTVIKLGAAVVGATTALLGIGTALTLMGPALPIVAAGLGLMLSPLVLIGAGLAAAAWFAYDFASELGWLQRGLVTIRDGLAMVKLGLEPLVNGNAADMYWINIGLGFVRAGVKQMGTDILTGIGNLVRDVTGVDLSAIGQTISTKLGELAVTAIGLKNRLLAAITAALPGTEDISLASISDAISGKLESLEITAPLLRGRVVEAINAALLGIDPTTGLTAIETNVRTALETALGGGAGDVTTHLAGRLEAALETDFGGLDLTAVQETVASDTQLAVHLGLAGAAAVIGGPLGMALSLANVVATAVANDFLGIRTALEASGILTTVESAFATLKGQIDGVIAGIFGGAGATGEGMGGPASMFRGEGGGIGAALSGFFDGLADIQLPDLSGVLSFVMTALAPIAAALQAIVKDGTLATGIETFGTGLAGFFEELGKADWSGLETVGKGLGILAGGLLQLAAAGVGNVLAHVGDTLPKIGAGIASIVDAFALAAGGDVGGALTSLANGLKTLADALLGIKSVDVEDSAAAQLVKEAFEAQGPITAEPTVAIDPVIEPPADLGETLQQALDTLGFGQGDKGGSRGFGKLTVPIEPAFETATLRETMQLAIDQAAAGGEDAETFKATAPLAMELAMSVASLHGQMQTAIHEASALDFHANLTLDMTLFPGYINVDAIRVAIAERLAGMAPLSSGGGGGGGPVRMYGMDVHAHGGLAAYTGPHWLERGERVLTVGESRFSGRSGGGNTYIINAYGSSPYELADMVARAERGRGGGV